MELKIDNMMLSQTQRLENQILFIKNIKEGDVSAQIKVRIFEENKLYLNPYLTKVCGVLLNKVKTKVRAIQSRSYKEHRDIQKIAIKVATINEYRHLEIMRTECLRNLDVIIDHKMIDQISAILGIINESFDLTFEIIMEEADQEIHKLTSELAWASRMEMINGVAEHIRRGISYDNINELIRGMFAVSDARRLLPS